jgi:hypothetical protein
MRNLKFTRSNKFLAQWGVGADLYFGAIRDGNQCIALIVSDGLTSDESANNAETVLRALSEMEEKASNSRATNSITGVSSVVWKEEVLDCYIPHDFMLSSKVTSDWINHYTIPGIIRRGRFTVLDAEKAEAARKEVADNYKRMFP